VLVQPAPESLKAPCQARVVEFAQFGGQNRQRDFTKRSLVVARGEFDQIAPGFGQRGNRVEHRTDGAVTAVLAVESQGRCCALRRNEWVDDDHFGGLDQS
jgi:hypothetical protein